MGSQSQSLSKKFTEEFRKYILNGDWPVNEMIQTEQELCQAYSVSRLTIRNVLAQLVHEGLLERKSGKGTWVRDFQKSKGIWNTEERSQYFAYPEHINTEIIGVEELLARSSSVTANLFEEDEVIARVKLVRIFRQTPVTFNYFYFKEALAKSVLEKYDPETDIFFYQVLEKLTGRMVVKIRERMKATIAFGEVASRLNVVQGHPLLEIRRDLYDQEGKIMQVNHSYLNSDLQEAQTLRTKSSNGID
jgi:GntR family transcriptional regulator